MAETDPVNLSDQRTDNSDNDAFIDLMVSIASSLNSIAKSLKSLDARMAHRDEPYKAAPLPTVKRRDILQPEEPPCPDCNTPLVRRLGSRGPFWGCPNFPKCKGTRDIKPREYVSDGIDHGDIPNIDEFEEGPF